MEISWLNGNVELRVVGVQMMVDVVGFNEVA